MVESNPSYEHRHENVVVIIALKDIDDAAGRREHDKIAAEHGDAPPAMLIVNGRNGTTVMCLQSSSPDISILHYRISFNAFTNPSISAFVRFSVTAMTNPSFMESYHCPRGNPAR